MPNRVGRMALTLVILLMGCSDEQDPFGPDDVDSLITVSGMDQQGWPGQKLPDSLVVQAIAGRSPVPGVDVVWRVVSGGGELDPTSSVTGSDGRVAATWTLGREGVSQRVVAEVGTSIVATFTADAAVTGVWEPVASLLHPVRAPAVATDGQRIFAFGGSEGASPRTAYTQIFDPSTGIWSSGADIPKAVDWSTAVHIGGFIHLMGGVTEGGVVTDEHWVYEVSDDSWSAGPPLPSPSAGSASAVVAGRIIVAGGIVSPGIHSENLHILEPESNQWSSGERTPAKLINWQGVEIDGGFFIAGGLAPGGITSSALYRYDLGSDAWTSHQPMPGANEGYAGAELLGLYCVIGGRIAPAAGSFSPPLDVVHCHDPEMQTWLTGPSLPTAAEEMGAAGLDRVLYVFGGRVSYSGVISEAYRLVAPGGA